MTLNDWRIRHHISHQAFNDLLSALGSSDIPTLTPPAGTAASEARVLSIVRLEAAQHDVWLSRNNVGAYQDERGRWVRYGLANESKQQNATIKSGDLIGFTRRVIVTSDVGNVIAQFTSRECKAEGWKPSNTPREIAQRAWRDFINTNGGDAAIVSGPGSFNY